MGKRISNAQKREIIERAGGQCEYCKSLMKFSPQPFVIEHIIPLALDGKTSLENLALSCGGCNGHKYTKTQAIDPVSGLTTPLFHPRKDNWTEHFEWDADYLLIIGITPVGRATAQALHLNRPELLHLRAITKLTGDHPTKQ